MRCSESSFGSPSGGFSWRTDRVLAKLSLEGVALVTLDVFDTLLLRRSGGPRTVFPLAARLARQAGALEPAMSDEAFALLREAAEREARKAGEVDLGRIYRCLPSGLGDPEHLAAAELEAERRLLAANPYLLDWLRELRRREMPVVLLSDMHLPGAELARLLAGCGVPADLYEALWVSCDHGVSKANGGLFQALLASRPGLAAEAVLHVGDNAHGDVAVPRSLGFRTALYQPMPRLAGLLTRERLLGASLDTPLTLLRTLAAQGLPDDAENGHADDRGFWTAFGALVLGPAVVHYADWVLRDAHAAGIRRIAPLLREGALLGELIAHRAAILGLPVTVHPLRLSREALRLPGLVGFAEADLRRLCGDGPVRTVRDVLRLLGLDGLPEAEELLGRPAIDVLGEAKSFAALRRRLLDPATVTGIRARAEAARDRVADYVAQELGEPGDVAVVDFGARGTMAALLHGIPALSARYRMVHYLFYAVPDFFTNALAGFRHRLFMPVDPPTMERARLIYRSPQPLEILLNGEEETTVGHQRDIEGPSGDGRIHAVTLPRADPPDAAWRRAVRACRAGIDHYRAVANGLDAPADWPVPARDLIDLLHRVIHLPTPEEAERLGSLPYDWNDGTRLVRPLCDESARTAVRELSASVRPECRLAFALQLRPSLVPWPQGALTLEDPFHIEELCGGARLDFGHAAFCRQLLHQLAAQGGRRVVVCGAGGEGGMGTTFIELARNTTVQVVGYLDHLVALPGGSFAGVPLLTPSDLTGESGIAFAVASTGYGRAIVASLNRACQAAGYDADCIWFDGAAFNLGRVGLSD